MPCDFIIIKSFELRCIRPFFVCFADSQDVRMFNLKKDERIDNDKLEEGGDEDADTAEAERPANETEVRGGRALER